MLLSFTVSNILSFKEAQTLSMVAVSHGKDDINPQNTFAVAEHSATRLLKSALVFGANASGKSNFIRAFGMLRDVVLHSQTVLDEQQCPTKHLIPFLLAQDTHDQPSVMEVVFYEDGLRYRYGLEVQAGKIAGEWLYYTPKLRETLLFERDSQAVEFNKQGFPEAAALVKSGQLQQTRDTVPFVSVLATRNGTHSMKLVNWFNRLSIISGTQEHGYMGFTVDLMQKDKDFKRWLLGVLDHFQIEDLNFVEVEAPQVNFDLPDDETELSDLLSSLNRFSKKQKSVELLVTKRVNTASGEQHVQFPLSIESEGTKKLIHLLGPIYHSIMNKRILIIDELEAKFHTLLTRYLFRLYHQHNQSGSQIIAAAHDTSLMNTQDFRRDQIWFVDKNELGSSELYSLVEFKERARQLKQQYGPDYLAGAFGAVSLFDNFDQIESMM
jgi:hypothetical protein